MPVIEEGNEITIAGDVVKSELRQGFDRLPRIEVLEVQFLFFLAQFNISGL